MKGNYLGLVNCVATESECIKNKTQDEVYLHLPASVDVKQDIPIKETDRITLGITNDEGVITLSSVEEMSVSESECEETVLELTTPAVTNPTPTVIGKQ